MSEISVFALSRIYAQGWKAANSLTASEHGDLSSEQTAALNPYKNDPERSRWSDGFREAVSK